MVSLQIKSQTPLLLNIYIYLFPAGNINCSWHNRVETVQLLCSFGFVYIISVTARIHVCTLHEGYHKRWRSCACIPKRSLKILHQYLHLHEHILLSACEGARESRLSILWGPGGFISRSVSPLLHEERRGGGEMLLIWRIEWGRDSATLMLAYQEIVVLWRVLYCPSGIDKKIRL